MRVAYALQGLLAASTTLTASYNPQHIVLGTDGTVVVGADPSLYFRSDKNQLYQAQDELEGEQELIKYDLNAKKTGPDDLPLVELPSLHDELIPADDLNSTDQVTRDVCKCFAAFGAHKVLDFLQETDEDKFSSSIVIQVHTA